MSILEDEVRLTVDLVERRIITIYEIKFKDAPKPPPIDMFKASAMAEIARRLKNRATKLEEDWIHFTR
jgi:hypothetical protein